VLTAYLTASEYFRPRRNLPVAIALEPPIFAPVTPFIDLPIPPIATLATSPSGSTRLPSS